MALSARFPLERDSTRATHSLLAQALTDSIDSHVFRAGDRLPPERELAEAYAISRSTVRQALTTLERRGRVTRSVGRGGGTFVSEHKLARDLSAFKGVTEHFHQQGVELRAEVLSADLRPARPGIAAALDVSPGDPVYEIVRIRHAHDHPVALERSCFVASLFPNLLEHDLSGRIYEVMRSTYHLVPECGREYIEALAAEAEEAEALAVAEGTPVMYVERIGYTLDGRPLEFSREFFRGDRTRVVVWSPDQPGPAAK